MTPTVYDGQSVVAIPAWSPSATVWYAGSVVSIPDSPFHRRPVSIDARDMNLALFDCDGTITRGDTWTLTGRYSRGECSAADKVIRLRERYDLARYPVIYAYGDTDEDREMLDIAHEKYYRWQKIGEGASLSSQHPAPARR